MHREYHLWHSPPLERDMELLVFGHGGSRVLVFPTSMGRFFDWENRGMIDAVGEQVERGEFQFYCVDSVDAESWYAEDKPPAERVARHIQYDRYLADEVLPFSVGKNPNPFVIAAGASFGAYHAVNFAFRYPELVGRVLGMSGLYDIRRFVSGYYNDNVYFNNPCDFMASEHDPKRIAALKRMDIILATGWDDANRGTNQQLSESLWRNDIWHALRLWDGWAHDWPYWQKMIQLYIGGHD
jgi:esterase/lipase superfamily enzyme